MLGPRSKRLVLPAVLATGIAGAGAAVLLLTPLGARMVIYFAWRQEVSGVALSVDGAREFLDKNRSPLEELRAACGEPPGANEESTIARLSRRLGVLWIRRHEDGKQPAGFVFCLAEIGQAVGCSYSGLAWLQDPMLGSGNEIVVGRTTYQGLRGNWFRWYES